MVGIILLFFIGKKYYELADTYNKHQLGYTLLGIATYYGGMVVIGSLLFAFLELGGYADIDSLGETEASFLAMPLGILSCWGLYLILKHSWSKGSAKLSEDILDAGELDKS